jgi:hypothetical protein
MESIETIMCKNCANRLAKWCYKKHPWFRVIREPFVFGLRMMAAMYQIKARPHVKNKECEECIRYMKNELQRKSMLFCFLNRTFGKWISKFRDHLLTEDEVKRAKQYAATNPWKRKVE